MKTGTCNHPKTIDLAARLGITRRDACGILVMLEEFVCRYCPQGDIGKWPDKAIAAALDMDDASNVIDALVGSGYIDTDQTHRLVVHEWAEHAPAYVKKQLSRKGLAIMSPERQTLSPERTHKGSVGKGSVGNKKINKKSACVDFEKQFDPDHQTNYQQIQEMRANIHKQKNLPLLEDAATKDGIMILADALRDASINDIGSAYLSFIRRKGADVNLKAWGFRGFANHWTEFIPPPVKTNQAAAPPKPTGSVASPEDIAAAARRALKKPG